jgi:putative transposase
MSRVARIVLPGVPHHITQRGNNRQAVFFTDSDYRVYLGLLHQHSLRFGLEIQAYCLMPNHIHLIAVPRSEKSLALAVGRTHYLYSQYVNRLHRRSGHLWQNRFFSNGLDEKHLYVAQRYVEMNPVRAKLARRAWDYHWSSAAAHCGGEDGSGLLALVEWRRRWEAGAWRKELAQQPQPGEIEMLRRATHTGRPLGTDSFLSKLEHALNRRLRPLPVGRPAKKKKRESK